MPAHRREPGRSCVAGCRFLTFPVPPAWPPRVAVNTDAVQPNRLVIVPRPRPGPSNATGEREDRQRRRRRRRRRRRTRGPTATATATARSDSDSDGDGDGEERQRRRRRRRGATARLSPPDLTWSWDGVHRASHGICEANRWSVWRFNGDANAALGPSWCSRREHSNERDSGARTGLGPRPPGGLGAKPPTQPGAALALPACDSPQRLPFQLATPRSACPSRLRLPAALALPACDSQQPLALPVATPGLPGPPESFPDGAEPLPVLAKPLRVGPVPSSPPILRPFGPLQRFPGPPGRTQAPKRTLTWRELPRAPRPGSSRRVREALRAAPATFRPAREGLPVDREGLPVDREGLRLDREGSAVDRAGLRLDRAGLRAVRAGPSAGGGHFRLEAA